MENPPYKPNQKLLSLKYKKKSLDYIERFIIWIIFDSESIDFNYRCNFDISSGKL
jgi:hypothetical protein